MGNEVWKTFKLGDVTEIVGGGTPSTKVAEYWEGDIPWLTPRDLTNHSSRYISKGERSISSLGLNNSSAKMLPKGTVLLTSRAPIGYLAIAENPICTNQGFKSLIPNPEFVDSQFLYYLLKNNVEFLKSVGTGTTFAEISGSTLANLEFAFPSLSTQQKIVEMLSAFDDKIDLNWRMNETLEAIAQAIFKEWFVDFNYPGATGKLVPSPLGPIPEGWQLGKLGDICHLENEKVNPIDIHPDTPYIGLEHLSRKSLTLNSFGYSKDVISDKVKFSKMDILFGKLRPYFHKVCIAPFDGVCSTDIFVIRPNSDIFFSYCLSIIYSLEMVSYASAHSYGTKMPRINWNDLSRFTIRIPPQELIKLFNDKFLPFYDFIRNIENNFLLRNAQTELIHLLI